MVYSDLDEIFHAYFSGVRAQEHTTRITEYYRSPGSSGYHAATQLVADAIKDAGAEEVTEERYPLDGKTRYLGRTMPLAWEPHDADLILVRPTKSHLISFKDVPSTLPWWCGSTSEDGDVVELVDVGHGLSPTEYAGKPVSGNAVLIRDSESRPAWAHAAAMAKAHGAVGIVTDFLHSQTLPWRTRRALPHAVQLLRFPPSTQNPWAFAVGYDVAERLSAMSQQGVVQIKARVHATAFKGEAMNLMATIHGAVNPEEKVLFIAHTSAGTKPCANCAAGPAMMIELCRAVTKAIGDGKLLRPARSICFLFVAEGLGSACYLDTHQDTLSNIKAAICLDSVGHSQSRLKSSLVAYGSPDSVPSYINDITSALVEELPKEADWPFLNGRVIQLINFQMMPYTPWSDNHYWAGVNVPAPLFMSWPDLYFHTQLLTADCTDPAVFERCGRVVGSLAVGIARAGATEVRPILQEIARKTTSRFGRVTRVALQRIQEDGRMADRAEREIKYLLRRDVTALYSAVDLAEAGTRRDETRAFADQLVAEVNRCASSELERLRACVPDTKAVDESMVPQPSDFDQIVPLRRANLLPPGVAGLTYDEMKDLVNAMYRDDDQVNWETLRIVGDELWNFSDGERSLSDISEAIGFEFGIDIHPQYLLILAQGLEKAKQLDLVHAR